MSAKVGYDHLLIDGRNLLHRVRAVTARRHVEVGGQRFSAGVASYFVKSIVLLYRDYANAGATVTVCWDGDRNLLVRRRWFVDYKGTRTTDPDFVEDERSTRAILRMLGIRQAWSPGWEADDVMATLATQGTGLTAILSADHDLLQLINDRIHVFDPNKRFSWDYDHHLWTPEEVVEKYGVMPNRIPEFKALTGDISDNIPGVGGIGPVKAKILLDKYRTASAIILADDRGLTGKIEIFKLNLRLCTLNKNVDITEHWKKPSLPLDEVLAEFRMMPLLPMTHQRAIRAMQKE